MLPFFMQDGKSVVTDASYDLTDRNQSLIIKLVQPEHEGVFSCLVENELGKEEAEGILAIAGKNTNITVKQMSHFNTVSII
jgi:hypothetical protein